MCNRFNDQPYIRYNKLKHCFIDITHCDVNGQNILFHASVSDIESLSFLLSNVCFPNGDSKDKTGQVALNQKDKYGRTIAHEAAITPRPQTVDTFKLLKKYNFNFNIYDFYGRLPIHYACTSNNHLLLSWMIKKDRFENNIINCKTHYAKNKQENGITPLGYAILYNSVECVKVLMKHQLIKITKRDITKALNKDNTVILKLLLSGLIAKCKICKWDDIKNQNQNRKSLISNQAIQKMISYCKTKNKDKCYTFLSDLYNNGYQISSYDYIVLLLGSIKIDSYS